MAGVNCELLRRWRLEAKDTSADDVAAITDVLCELIPHLDSDSYLIAVFSLHCHELVKSFAHSQAEARYTLSSRALDLDLGGSLGFQLLS